MVSGFALLGCESYSRTARRGLPAGDARQTGQAPVASKNIIPIHYNSNPLTKGTLAEFQTAMKQGDNHFASCQ
jgi:L-ascorbate metabolism protein UlaG (beta-lactamase superfamily)